MEGLSRFSSPEGPKGYSCLGAADPLDQMGGLLREAVPKASDVNRALSYREPRRKSYEKTVVLLFLFYRL